MTWEQQQRYLTSNIEGTLPTIQLQFRACFSPECLRQVEMGLKWKRRTVRVNWRVVCDGRKTTLAEFICGFHFELDQEKREREKSAK